MVDDADFYATSPVPSDRFLWGDEKPFTAFGQFGEGRLDQRVFDQDIWWVDTHGKAHLLKEMSTDYLSNILGFLYSNLELFHASAAIRQTIEYVLVMIPSTEGPKDFQGFVDYVTSRSNLADVSAVDWLAGTVLVKQIIMLLDSEV